MVSREVSPEWLDRWQEIEEQATTLLWFEPLVVPGLLQVEEYARAVLRAGRYHRTDVEDKVATRMDRQRILDRDDPAYLVVLLDESVLRRAVGGAEVMTDQLTRLADAAEGGNTAVYVVPFDAPASAGFLSTFIVASFDGGNEVAYVDNQLRGEVVEQPDEVAMLRQLFERFRADARSKQESIDLIRRIVKDQWTA